MAFELVKGSAKNGHNIVSDPAAGIDAAVHRGTLAALGGITTAALGAGFGNLIQTKSPTRPANFLAVGATLFEYLLRLLPAPITFLSEIE